MIHFIPAEAKSSGCRILGPRENIHRRRSGSGSGSPWTPGALEPSLSHTNAPTPHLRQALPPPHNHTYNSKAQHLITRDSLITSIQVLFTFIFNDLIISSRARQIGTCGLLWANFKSKDLWFCDNKQLWTIKQKVNCLYCVYKQSFGYMSLAVDVKQSEEHLQMWFNWLHVKTFWKLFTFAFSAV